MSKELAWTTSASADDHAHDQETDLSAIGSPGGAIWASVAPEGNGWNWTICDRWLWEDADILACGSAGTEELAKAAVTSWAEGHMPSRPCEVDDCDNPAVPCECGAAHCPDHPHEGEWRVHGNPAGDGRYAVSELTCDHGLMPVITGLDRWQALAIVAILVHPHGD